MYPLAERLFHQRSLARSANDCGWELQRAILVGIHQFHSSGEVKIQHQQVEWTLRDQFLRERRAEAHVGRDAELFKSLVDGAERLRVVAQQDGCKWRPHSLPASLPSINVSARFRVNFKVIGVMG